jgi:putative sterol carrier protein
MMDPTAEFFEELGRRGHEPLLEKATGSIRIDLTDGRRTERWRVAIDNGDVEVARAGGEADCVVRADRALFEEIITGRANAFAALLRGDVDLDGNPELIVLFQRLFPSPPRSRSRRRTS